MKFVQNRNTYNDFDIWCITSNFILDIITSICDSDFII